MRDDGAHGDTEPKGRDGHSRPVVKEGCGVLITCPSSLPVEAPGTQEQNPGSAPPQGEKPGSAFCSCAKGPARNEDRKLQRNI